MRPCGSPVHESPRTIVCGAFALLREKPRRLRPDLCRLSLPARLKPVSHNRNPQKNVWVPVLLSFLAVAGIGVYATYLVKLYALPAVIKAGFPTLGAAPESCRLSETARDVSERV